MGSRSPPAAPCTSISPPVTAAATGPASGLDVVAAQAMLGPRQPPAAGDAHGWRAGAFDLGPHAGEELAQLHDVRLAGGVPNLADAGAAAAASRAVSVPVTDASSRYSEAARRPSGASSTKSPPRSCRRRTPIASSACRWADRVRRAGKSPPGGAKRTRPTRASRGPHNSTEPRRRPTRSASGVSPVTCPQSTRRVVVPPPLIPAPSPPSRSDITCTSLMRGTLVRTLVPSVSRQAASSGRAAFLLPSTSMRPSRRCPPSTTRLFKPLPTDLAMSVSSRRGTRRRSKVCTVHGRLPRRRLVRRHD